MSHVIIIMIHLETATSRRWGKAPAKHENYINTLWGVAGKVQTWTGARQTSKATKIIGMLSQMPTHIHYTSARPMGSVCCILYCVCAQTFGQNVKTVACPRVFINASGGMLENTLNRCTFTKQKKGIWMEVQNVRRAVHGGGWWVYTLEGSIVAQRLQTINSE